MKKSLRCTTLLVVSALLLLAVALPAAAHPKPPKAIVVGSGQTLVVDHTITTCALIIKDGGAISAPGGHSVTLTVNGVETGQALVTTEGVDTAFVAGKYLGDVVLTATEANPVDYVGMGRRRSRTRSRSHHRC